jgi:hypothetical protein
MTLLGRPLVRNELEFRLKEREFPGVYLSGDHATLVLTVRNLSSRIRRVRFRILVTVGDGTFIDPVDLLMDFLPNGTREAKMEYPQLPAAGLYVVSLKSGARSFDDDAKISEETFRAAVKVGDDPYDAALGTFRVFDKEQFLQERSRFRTIAILSAIAAVAAISAAALTAVLILLRH